jgi:KDO2-lipid IV(A) lauroyltransferase
MALPAGAARRAGALYGDAAYLCLPRLRRRMLGHLGRAFPERPPADLRRIGRGVTRWVGRAGADFLHLDRRSVARMAQSLEVEGWEHWRPLVESGRGLVAVTGHYGNWELLGAWLASLGRPITVLYHPFREQRLDRWVAERRLRGGVRVLSAEARGPAPLRVLRRGGVLGILLDRVPRTGGIPCRFFGRECRAAEGPARLALAAGAPILPVMLRYEGGGYRARFSAPIAVEDAGQVAEVTQRLTSILEEWIREAPEQWPWFDDRWRIRGNPA